MAVDANLPLTKNEDSARGFGFALAAYLFWGVLPLYMKALAHIPAPEVIAHRILWSVPIAGAVLLYLRRTDDLKAALRSPRTIALASMTALLITVNWGTYVWAIGHDRSLDAALGYFMNPLFSIALGSVLLKEKMSPAQLVAVALAAVAVLIIAIAAGRPPWIAMLIMLSWGFYAYFRKTLPVGPNQGFFLEVVLLSVLAVPYIIYLEARGEGHLMATGLGDTMLLVGCGFVTAVPLMVYANGAKLLRLSTIGIMQYIVPTMVFLLAVFVFGEPLDTARMVAFPMIWAGLFIYTWSMLKASRGR